MRLHGGERVLVIAAVALAVGGVAFELVAGTAPTQVNPRVSGPRLVARTSYCAPAASKGESHTAVGGAADTGVRVRVGRASVEPLAGGDMLLRRWQGRSPVRVVGFGGSVEAGSLTSARAPVGGAAATACAVAPSPHWYFGEGSSALGYDERLLVYNPFPDEAVVRVTLFTPKGPRERAGLADIPVHAGTVTSIAINKAVRIMPVLGARVTAVRGRVVAWRAMFADPRNAPHGVQLSLGAPKPSTIWYFPDGAVGDGYDERITIVNPSSDEEAVVTVTLSSEKGSVQPARMVELPIPAGTARAIEVNKAERALQPGVTATGATVTSINGVAVVAERSVAYSTGTLSGLAAEVGAIRTSTEWFLPPAAARPDYDAIILLNPGKSQVHAAVSFERKDGGRMRPTKFARVAIGPGRRVKLSIAEETGGAPVVALVKATGPVVAERFAAARDASDVAAVMGLPLRRIAP